MDSRGRPGGVGEQMPHRHGARLGMTVLDVEPREVVGYGVIQPQRAGVPLAQHTDRGEQFRVRGDTEDRVLRHRGHGIERRVTIRLEPDDLLIVDDPDHQSGQPGILDLSADPLVEQGDSRLNLRVGMLCGGSRGTEEESGEDSARHGDSSRHVRVGAG